MYDYFKRARRELVDSLVREGVSPEEASEEAADYVSSPSGRAVPEDDLARLIESIGREAVSDELMDMLSAGEVQELAVWDLDFRSGGSTTEHRDDAYLGFVLHETRGIQESFPALTLGVTVGVGGDGCWVWVANDGRVYLLDHEEGALRWVASSLRDFVAVNAELASLYYARLVRPRQDENWMEAILWDLDSRSVDRSWITLSLASRPRPN